MIPLNHRRPIEKSQNMRFCIFDIGNWPKGKIFINEMFNNLVVFTQSDMHLNSSLTVTYVVNFLVADFMDIVEESRKVIVRHVLECELPKFLAFIGVQLSVISRMLIASAISQPYIVSLIGNHEAGSLVFVIDDPGVRTIEESMLKNDWLQPFLNDTIFPLNSENSQDVSVLSHDLVLLNGVVVEFAVVSEVEFGLGVGRQSQPAEKQYGDQKFDQHWRFIICDSMEYHQRFLRITQ